MYTRMVIGSVAPACTVPSYVTAKPSTAVSCAGAGRGAGGRRRGASGRRPGWAVSGATCWGVLDIGAPDARPGQRERCTQGAVGRHRRVHVLVAGQIVAGDDEVQRLVAGDGERGDRLPVRAK